MDRGIDNAEHLFRFFAAKGHKNLVLRVADLLELRRVEQERLIKILYGVDFNGPGSEEFRTEQVCRWLKGAGYMRCGYLVIAMARLEAFDMVALTELQQIVALYRNVRRGRGEPSELQDHTECGGRGCPMCGHTGKIRVFLEVSEEEKQLAME